MSNKYTPSCYGYGLSSSDYFSNNSVGSPSMLTQNQIDGVGANNPLHTKFSRCWRVMRDCIEGQDAVRQNAEKMKYLQIPQGVVSNSAHNENEIAKHHYVNKAHYIEVVPRMLDEVEGRIFSKKYKLQIPDKMKSIINKLDSDGLSFDQYARWCVREVFGVKRFGNLVDWDEETETPVLKRYVAESIVNWKLDRSGNLILVVLEDEIDEPDQIFSHNKIRRRVSFTKEKDANNDFYVVQRTFLQKKGPFSNGVREFEESEKPAAMTRRGKAIQEIPFIFFGGVTPTAPMLKPLAAASLDFFDAHASYRNALWWATTEQPYITFDTSQDREFGFYDDTIDEEDGSIKTITWGSATPIVLKDGEIKFAHVSGIGLTAARQRLIDCKAEMTGLGARSFNAQTASNIKVQTERMQQRAEGSVIGSIAFAISMGIKQALEIARDWNDITGEISFELNQDFTDDFEIPFLKEISEAVDKLVLPEELVWDYLRVNTDFIPEGISNEQIREMIQKKSDPFGFNDIDEV